MSAHSLSQVKNYIGHTLRKAVDPDPSAKQIQALWAHFESRCAYCGCELDPDNRKAHRDHLEASGRNHISNRVLSCGVCNGDDKRERNWESFLSEKCGSAIEVHKTRRQRILDWQGACGKSPDIDAEVAAQVARSIEVCCATLEDHYKRLQYMSNAHSSAPTAAGG
jgi:hypothetical protein